MTKPVAYSGLSGTAHSLASGYIRLAIRQSSPVYDCADVIPKGLQRYPGDQNAHCVFWSTYPPAVSRKLSDEEISSRLLGGDYEKELIHLFQRRVLLPAASIGIICLL